jgi:flagellar export protein FliJ
MTNMVSKQEKRLGVMLRPMRHSEEVARQDFARATCRAQEYLDQALQLEAELRCQHAAAGRSLRNGDEFSTDGYRHAVATIQNKLSRIMRLADQAQEQVEKCRIELIESMGRRKAFGKMLERISHDRRLRADQKESAELDDVHAASTAWRRESLDYSQADAVTVEA